MRVPVQRECGKGAKGGPARLLTLGALKVQHGHSATAINCVRSCSAQRRDLCFSAPFCVLSSARL